LREQISEHEMIIMIGKEVKPYGKVAAIANGGSYGERYYFFVDKWGGVAMIPAVVVEAKE
jgi:hypothetical protein